MPLWARVAIPLLFGTAAFLGWYLFRPAPLLTGAGRLADALRDGDGAALYRATHSYERTCSDLTPAKMQQAWDILLAPYIRSSKVIDTGRPEMVSNKVQADATVHFLDSAGTHWSITGIVSESEEGPIASVVYSMLATASLFDEDGHYQTDHPVQRALAGVRKYRAPLERIGIHRVMLGLGRDLSWDELEADLAKHAANSQSRQ